jgi:hypothetical protein
MRSKRACGEASSAVAGLLPGRVSWELALSLFSQPALNHVPPASQIPETDSKTRNAALSGQLVKRSGVDLQ